MIESYLLNFAVLVDIAASNALELKVAGDLSVKQDLHHVATSHDELWDQIHIPVSGMTQVSIRLSVGLVLGINIGKG